jgi:tryptophanyl-tRNA synthetase
MNTRVLTGITTSGTPHLGNYVGAIRPAIQASLEKNVDAFFFLADYHALIKCEDPDRIARSRLEIAATWLASGLDPERVTFYRQSDIPEIPELCWMLTCVTAKGLMNRAHAYKASVDQNIAKSVDPDDGINMGLFSYPILMAADILLYDAEQVPVGKDQLQHLEMARDVGARFNHLMGDVFVLPDAKLQEETMYVPGTDGQKMSKSRGNIIDIFQADKALRKQIMQIETDSTPLEEPKNPDTCNVFAIYKLIANTDQVTEMRSLYEARNYGYGHAKQALYELVLERFKTERSQYQYYMSHLDEVDQKLKAGALKAQTKAKEVLGRVRERLGFLP